MLADPHGQSGAAEIENGYMSPTVDTAQLVRAARQLLSSVTRFDFDFKSYHKILKKISEFCCLLIALW
jgi:hypothetical protein